jgi:peptidoglycan/xylan/chitin deacetylase (PgdA/CDA1 family)
MLPETKYRLLWLFGTIVSFILYFSGIVPLYSFLRKKTGKYMVRVLTYHRVADHNEDPNITVSPECFEKQIKYLKDFTSIVPLCTIIAYARGDKIPQNDAVALTFDDGYCDNYSNAFKTLRSHSLPATIFLISNAIGKEGMLTVPQINAMTKNRITFGSHTMTHPTLSEIPEKDAEEEIRNSKNVLVTRFNLNVEYFAYPKGKKNTYNKKIKLFVEEAGYTAAFSTENKAVGVNNDLYDIGRIGIRECPMFVFKSRLSGIYESNFFYTLRNFFGFI